LFAGLQGIPEKDGSMSGIEHSAVTARADHPKRFTGFDQTTGLYLNLLERLLTLAIE
jgi:hypothetical protein